MESNSQSIMLIRQVRTEERGKRKWCLGIGMFVSTRGNVVYIWGGFYRVGVKYGAV